MVVDTDTHSPDDMIDLDRAQQVAAGAGLSPQEVWAATVTHPQEILARVLAARRSEGQV
jgi:histidinol phosphatase-like PHP family hydrolase